MKHIKINDYIAFHSYYPNESESTFNLYSKVIDINKCYSTGNTYTIKLINNDGYLQTNIDLWSENHCYSCLAHIDSHNQPKL